jgi:adenine deaminase
MNSFSVTGNLVDIHQQIIYPAAIRIQNGRIVSIKKLQNTDKGNYILPGFIDSHVHIESSMLVPSEFARLAVVHGTVATVSDPHEIANVCGMKGVEFMIANGKTVPFKFYFGAPSCVPATIFETAGATLDAADVAELLKRDEIHYLSEMMNFPGVLNKDEEVLKKLSSAKSLNKPIDGHAPGLRGSQAKQYIEAGISTDHECFTREEALDKLKYGMKIIIREGSAARNFEALIDLLNDYPDQMMFCSDDKHPDSLVLGHINQLCERAVKKGIPLFNILKAACLNPVIHYKLDVGLLREGDRADFIIVNDLSKFETLRTFIDGIEVSSGGKTRITSVNTTEINNFGCTKKEPSDFQVRMPVSKSVSVIEALDGQLITNKIQHNFNSSSEFAESDTDNDILKIAVVNRYKDLPVAVSFIKNFGLKQGAIASSVAHDSHNIVAVGVDDESLCQAVNMVIAHRGGVSCVKENLQMMVPLTIAGLMSDGDGYHVARQYSQIDQAAKDAGSTLSAPFMTLSFMALLVIPHLKLSDLGLFDGDSFSLVK